MAITNGIIQSVLDYYGSSSSIYRKIVLGTATDSEISFAFTQIPMMQPDVSASGQFLGITYADPVYITQAAGSGIAGSVNSNAAGGAYSNSFNARVPVSFGRDAGTGQAYITGAQQAGATLATIADRAALGVTGVNLGCKLGKLIDQTLYNLSPDWWDEHYPTINPETWPSIVGNSETGQKFFRTLFGIEDNGNVTGYVDERVLAQTYQMLRDMGVISNNPPDQTNIKPVTVGGGFKFTELVTPETYTYPIDVPFVCLYGNNFLSVDASTGQTAQIETSSNVYLVRPRNARIYLVGFDGAFTAVITTRTSTNTINSDYTTITINGSNKTVYFARPSNSLTIYNNFVPLSGNKPNYGINVYPMAQEIAYMILLGEFDTSTPVDGITDIPTATQYPPTAITGTTLDDVLTQLKQTYPQLFEGGISETVLQPAGTTTTVINVPVPWVTENPENVIQTAPVTRPDAQQTDYIIDQTTAGEIIADKSEAKRS